MRVTELKKCAGCGKIPTAGHTTFHVLTHDRAVVDVETARTVAELELAFRGATDLAEAFAPDPEIIKLMGDADPATKSTLHVCEACAFDKSLWELLWDLPEGGA